jgi:hypothetical protein
MSQNVFPIHDNTTIVLKMHGDLDLQGWDRADAAAICGRRHLKVVQGEEKQLHIICKDDCLLSLPKNVSVVIEHVGGDLNVRNLDQALTVGHVGGDMAVYDLVSLEAQKIGGDVDVFDVPGAVAVRRVGGDLTAFRLGASLRADIGGDAELAALAGDVQLRSGGDLDLDLQQFGSQPVYLHTGGDITVHVPADINAVLNISSAAHEIRVSLAGKNRDYEQDVLRTQLGQGGGELSISAGGDVHVTDVPMKYDDLKERLADLEEDWQDRLEDIEDEEEHPLGEFDSVDEEGTYFRGDGDDIGRQINERVSQAMQRVEEAMRRMNDRLGQKGGRFGGMPPVRPVPPVPPVPAVPPVPPLEPVPANPVPWNPPDAQAFAVDESLQPEPSDEERQIILRMLQEKKISASEADELLRALGA